MKISLNWIQDFIDLSQVSFQDIAQKITLHTAEVEQVEFSGQFFKNIWVAEIIQINKHPQADQLNLVQFQYADQTGKVKLHEVVCGAPNVKIGLKVPLALEGTVFPDGFTLTAKKIRGIESKGMLCSAKELGLGDQHQGLLELDSNRAKLGMNLAQYLDQNDDLIVEIDNKSLTHRPDLWGHVGFVRELGTIYNQKNQLEEKLGAAWESKWKDYFKKAQVSSQNIKPEVEGLSSCQRYLCFNMEGVQVTQSPSWMQKRLESVGLKPINNLVDISNYVMLELGIPSHIFDRDLIEPTPDRKIKIARLNKTESLESLDGKTRNLIAQDTVILDSKGPLVIAGIMGGQRSAVSEKTKNILVEVANWAADEVRKTSTRLGLATDSSRRYEKSLDSYGLEKVAFRILELILQLCPGSKLTSALFDQGPISTTAYQAKVIRVSDKKLNARLGKEVAAQEIERIFKGLGFKVIPVQLKENTEVFWDVEVPSFRAPKDISMEADLLEELGRMVGYDNIEALPPLTSMQASSISSFNAFKRKIADFLSQHEKFYEVMTYPLLGEKLLEKSFWVNDESTERLLKIKNALSVEASILRPSLIPQLLESTAKNLKNYDQFHFFELGRTYFRHSGQNSKNQTPSLEKEVLALAMSFTKAEGLAPILASVERLLGALDLSGNYQWVYPNDPKLGKMLEKALQDATSAAWLPKGFKGTYPKECVYLMVRGKIQGVFFSVHPILKKNFKIDAELVLGQMEIDFLQELKSLNSLKFKPLAKHPASFFDCSVVVDYQKKAGEIIDALDKGMKANKDFIKCKVVDIFDLGDGKKSVTLRSKFFNPEKTLDSAQIKSLEDMVVKSLNGLGFPLKGSN